MLPPFLRPSLRSGPQELSPSVEGDSRAREGMRGGSERGGGRWIGTHILLLGVLLGGLSAEAQPGPPPDSLAVPFWRAAPTPRTGRTLPLPGPGAGAAGHEGARRRHRQARPPPPFEGGHAWG